MPRPDLFSELKRRKVYRVGAAYLAVVFGGLQGADLVFPALGLGPRAFNGLVLASLLGFPAVVALAWMFDITAQGVRRTGPADEPSGDLPAGWASDRWARVKLVLVGAGFMGLAWFGVHLWQVPSATPHTEVMPGPRPVLAVLPFEDMSPGGDQAYFVDGLHEELLHQLAVLKGIELRSRTAVEHFRGSPSDVSAIADSLGAGYVLEGSVRRAPDSVRVTAQLIDGTTDQHLWSESFSRPLSVEGIFALQQELATRLARSLGATLASGEVRSLGPPPTRSADAYNAYLLGIYHSRVGGGTDALLTALDDFR
ncbi:MAG TPA: hypothetical protein VLA36_00280, partial [Longimicrobiales bacterium]|nr:hypothetical protein [Longimicrobiales bacterium]